MLCGFLLARHGHELTAEPSELEDFAVDVAVNYYSVEEIAKWLEAHSA